MKKQHKYKINMHDVCITVQVTFTAILNELNTNRFKKVFKTYNSYLYITLHMVQLHKLHAIYLLLYIL